jgi:tetratricopeptide (TPR) repeat protein
MAAMLYWRHEAMASLKAVYDRAAAHLFQGLNAEALAGFNEAIRLDPDAPNAYIGRAIARRRLGDEAGALRDEEAAQELGGPEKTAWDRLVNRAYRRLKRDLLDVSRDEFYRRLDPLSRKAVLLSELNRQILNGGLAQWVANGYAQWIDDVIEAARAIGTDNARHVASALEDLSQILQIDGLDEDEAFRRLSECEGRYFEVQMRFVRDVVERLEEESRSEAIPAEVEPSQPGERPSKRPWWRFWA